VAFSIPKATLNYFVDLGERVGSTFLEAVLAGMTTSALLTQQPWTLILNTAGYAALYAFGKGVIAYVTPPQGSAQLLPTPTPRGNSTPQA
jgi:hypothetical protein